MRITQRRFTNRILRAIPSILIFLTLEAPAPGADIMVRDAKELRDGLRGAQPGATIRLAPGNYSSAIGVKGLNGTKDKPIVIAGADARNKPLFAGGNEAIHFVDCNYITLRNIRVSGCSGNGINADDGGSFDTPSRGMVFENVTIEDVGPTGNRDGLKLSGLDDFVVRNCRISGWGGSAIDMVGCHDGVIEGCQIIGKRGFSQNTGIQVKGGSENVLIKQNFFKNAGGRAVNIGGSTGLQYFRPKLRDYEAKAIEVAGNHFVGSMVPVAYVTSIKCLVRQNTIINPGKWVLRILQEQPTDKFQPCQQGVFEANLVVFDKRVRTFVNIGPNTKPETFVFRKNAWFCSDGNRRPSLPAKEIDGVYQIDPKLQNLETPSLKVGSRDLKLQGIGAHAFRMQN